jgi:hypothetical protein
MKFIIPDFIIWSLIQHLEIRNNLVWSSLAPGESAELARRLQQVRDHLNCCCCHRHQRNRGRLITSSQPHRIFSQLKHELVDAGQLCSCMCRLEVRLFLYRCLRHRFEAVMDSEKHDLNYVQIWRRFLEFPSFVWYLRQTLYFETDLPSTNANVVNDSNHRYHEMEEFLDSIWLEYTQDQGDKRLGSILRGGFIEISAA